MKRVFLMDDEEIQAEIDALRPRTARHTPEERKRYDRLTNEKDDRIHFGSWTLGRRDPRRTRRDATDNELFGPITRVYELQGDYYVLHGGELEDVFRSPRAAVRRAKVLTAQARGSRPPRRDEPKRSLLARIFRPRPAGPRAPSAAEREAREQYRRTGKHFWYGVTRDGLDMSLGRFATRSEARAEARRKADRLGRGPILRIYHLDA